MNDDRDIVDRLSDLCGDVGRWAGETIGEAMDEIGRLRLAIRRLAEQDATLSVCDGSVTVTMDAPGESQDSAAILRAEIERLTAEVERHRMTPQERRMSASAADFMSHPGIDPEPLAMSAEINVILDYLARTKPQEPFNG